MSSLDWSTTKTPVISNQILAISRRNAFICIYSNFSPTIGCHGNAPLSLVYGSVTEELPDSTVLSQNQTLHAYVAYNWSYRHICDIFAYFGHNFVAKATSLWPLQSEMSSLDWSATKPPVISNRILVISHTNAFICLDSYFSPKVGCHSNAPLSLVYGSVTDEFPDGTNPISKPNSAWICRLQLKLWPFLWFFLAYFG